MILRRTVTIRLATVTAAVVVMLGAGALGPPRSTATPSLGTLSTQLSQERAHQHSLASSINSLNGLISALDRQIQLVQSREAAVQAELTSDRAALAAVQVSLKHERRRLASLRRQLAAARSLLSNQLVSSYESDKPDLMTVVLNAHGFNDLLEQMDFLGRAEKEQTTLITNTRQAKARADRAARQLAALELTDRQITQRTMLRVNALAGMNILLQSKQHALQGAQSAQQAALAASRARGQHLQSEINRVQAEQAAAERAAAQAAQPSALSGPGPALGPSGGWAIPYAIVLCESGGQNMPPNSAGASGYYQIIPSTWKLFGGSGPAAYLAGKAEQDAVATRIWNGGAGASNWVCAGIVGIH